jgi:predicted RNase H-like nuclease (RuvC/YqgF family)
LAVQVERDRKELEAARGTAELLSAENSRLSEENKRLRTVVKSLIAAVDGDRRRHTDQLGEAERRLRGLSRTT